MAATTERAPKAGHPKIVAVLVGFATLIAFVAIFSIWANRQALNTDNWVNTSEQDPAEQEGPGTALRLRRRPAVRQRRRAGRTGQGRCRPSCSRWPVPPPPGSASWRRRSPNARWPPRRCRNSGPTPTAAAHEALLEVLDGGGEERLDRRRRGDARPQRAARPRSAARSGSAKRSPKRSRRTRAS